jgi:hypothetical protein
VPDLGDVLPFALTVKDAAGALANATSVTLAITRDGVAEPGSPFTVTPTSTGLYDKDYAAPAAGHYVGRWVATGTNACAYVQVFDVEAADPGYLFSLARAKQHLNITSTTSDEELREWMSATTRIIERLAGPVLVRTVTDERHDGGGSLWLRHPPVLTDAAGLAAVTVTPWLTSGTTYAVADLRVSPSGRVERRDGGAFTGGPFAVTYQAGRRVIPANISGAGLVVLKGLWETQRGAGGLPLQGADELVTEPGMGLVMWRAKQLLEPDELVSGFA